MKVRLLDPARLDVETFAANHESLSGEWPLAAMPRLLECCHLESSKARESSILWGVRGETRRSITGETQVWLHLQAEAQLALVCQRCLGPVETGLRFVRPLRFVRGEESAAALDADSDEDVLAMTRSLDLQALVEDELLLALPLVPRHDRCMTAVPLSELYADEDAQADEANPFAALSILKQARSDSR